MNIVQNERPRDVNYLKAAGILYGDLGTSKAYVLGLAFAFAGYSSFWYILAIGVLTLIVGLNYIEICKLYPDGGGVYTSARNHSKVLALVGAFFLISDYIITAALSSVSAFHYLGFPHPQYCAMLSIAAIGLFNLVGPKHTGKLSVGLALPTFIAVICLAAFSLPYLPTALDNLTPISPDFFTNWNIFIGIVVALSGIESIANTTGSMILDPGSTNENPSVSKTATKAILIVIAEVCIFTVLLGLAMNALPDLVVSNGEINAPNHPNVRDTMLRYMGEVFAGNVFGTTFGYFFSLIVSVVFTFLLLSAVNTALIALISLLFIMSKDNEMPTTFQKLNSFGVPIFPTLASFICPIFILFFVSDILGLASLYAVGFVGAIAVNLMATSTNRQLNLNPFKRVFMFATFIIMFLIEISLFIDKPNARTFVLFIVSLGLLMRAFVQERKENGELQLPDDLNLSKIPEDISESSLVVLNGLNKSLDFSLKEAEKQNHPLYVLFVREQSFVTKTDQKRLWVNDQDASKLFNHILSLKLNIPMEFLYVVTSDTAQKIVDIAKLKKVSQIIIGRKRKFSLMNFLRGTTVNDLVNTMPNDIDLLVVY